MSSLRHVRQRGFTIVELLIVIVVIAILASITVVAYTGISQRARNTARIAAVKQAEQAVQIAVASNSVSTVLDALNSSGGWKQACIGSGHASLDADSTPDCGAYGGEAYVSESTELNELLRDAGSLPSMATYPKTTSTDSGGGDVVSGPYLELLTIDGADYLSIEYSLEGEKQDCSVASLVYGSEGSHTFTKPATGSQYSSTGSGVTECRYAVSQVQ